MSSARDLADKWNMKPHGRNSWRGTCPSCGYEKSCVVTERAGRVLIYCHASCDRDRLMRLLDLGEANSELGPQPSRYVPKKRSSAFMKRWSKGIPCRDTPAARYLEHRMLPDIASSPSLRFQIMRHPTGIWLPAMLALVVDVAGQPAGLHVTFLKQCGEAKIDLEPARITMGAVRGGMIPLAPFAPTMVVGEGIETSAAAGRMFDLPSCSAISAGNLAEHLVLPPTVRHVIIAADADLPGQQAAQRASERWAAAGIQVEIAEPDLPGKDFADLLKERDA